MTGDLAIKVLIAEDEANLGDLLQSYLVGRGHFPPPPPPPTTLGALRAQPFDVALLDIVMPEMDGLEVLRQVRDDPSPPECIIITGNSTIDTAIAAMRPARRLRRQAVSAWRRSTCWSGAPGKSGGSPRTIGG